MVNIIMKSCQYCIVSGFDLRWIIKTRQKSSAMLMAAYFSHNACLKNKKKALWTCWQGQKHDLIGEGLEKSKAMALMRV